MKKVLLLHKGGSGGIRGTEACLIQSIAALRKAGYELTFARNLPVIDNMVSGNVKEVIEINFPEILINRFNSQLPLIDYAKAFRKLISVITKLRPQLIYVSGGLPCQLAVPIGRLFKIPVLCQFHHPANRRYYYCWLLPFADKLIFPSKFTQSDAQSKANISGDIVYPGIDINKFKPVERDIRLRRSLSIDDNAIVIGQVGQLVATKRPLLLLSAFAKAIKTSPHLHLCLVGRGPLEEAIRREIVERRLEDKVTVTGFVEEVLPFYQQVFDINALVSSEEGLGISVLEGAACGLPSLIADCTGLRETIIDGETGCAFPPNDEDALVRRIVEMAQDKEFLDSAGANGRRLVENQFSLSAYELGITEVVDDLIEGCALKIPVL